MSDLFHDNVPLAFIKKVFETMNEADQHIYQILTKRSERLMQLHDQLSWKKNIWMGVSIEDVRVLHRLNDLKKTTAYVKWLSLEPLLGPLPNLDLDGIDWVVVGGESGPKARHMQADWVREIRDQCMAANVPFFFKQWGKLSNNPDPSDPTAVKNGGKSKGGRILDGRLWGEMPAAASVNA
jgi:protein gp37